jgi:hypothetical protein
MTEGSISHAICKDEQQPCVDGPWDETAKPPVIGAGKHREFVKFKHQYKR